MNTMRWDPFGDVHVLLNHHLNPGSTRAALDAAGLARKIEWQPTSDISETEAEYGIRAELPGVRKEDVLVSLESGVLTIKGERKALVEDKGLKLHRIESFYGNFERSFTLPENIDAESVHCDSKDGVLTVHIPKKAAALPAVKKIPVN